MASQVKAKKPRKKTVQDDVVLDSVESENEIEAKQKPNFVLVVKNQSHLKVYEPSTRTVIEPYGQATIYCLSELQKNLAVSNFEQQKNPLLEVNHA